MGEEELGLFVCVCVRDLAFGRKTTSIQAYQILASDGEDVLLRVACCSCCEEGRLVVVEKGGEVGEEGYR